MILLKLFKFALFIGFLIILQKLGVFKFIYKWIEITIGAKKKLDQNVKKAKRFDNYFKRQNKINDEI